MAKVTNQVIPPELDTAARRLITPFITLGGPVTKARKRKGTRRSSKKTPAPEGLNDFTPAARYVAQLMSPNKSTRQNAALVRALVRDMKAGIFDLRYWVRAELVSTEYLSNNPTSVPDPNPPPYNYRTPLFLPTIPTYTDGTTGAAGMAYAGSKHGTYFQDDSLSWGKYIYELPAKIAGDQPLFAFAVITGNVSVTSSARASKPMLSLISSAAIVNANDSAVTSKAPITAGIPVSAPTQTRLMQSHYWRYRIPKTTPPYFNRVGLRPIVRNVVRSASMGVSAKNSRIILQMAPRPMFGRGFNNNNAVNTSFTGSAVIWVMLQNIGGFGHAQYIWSQSGKEYTYTSETNDSIFITTARHVTRFGHFPFENWLSYVASGELRFPGFSPVFYDLISSQGDPLYGWMEVGSLPTGPVTYNRTTKTATWQIVEKGTFTPPPGDNRNVILYQCTQGLNQPLTKTEISRHYDPTVWAYVDDNFYAKVDEIA
ncbi:MAG TPA: hypothetical protein VIY48_20500 [Candidatus Paceibacterota bacterium]